MKNETKKTEQTSECQKLQERHASPQKEHQPARDARRRKALNKDINRVFNEYWREHKTEGLLGWAARKGREKNL